MVKITSGFLFLDAYVSLRVNLLYCGQEAFTHQTQKAMTVFNVVLLRIFSLFNSETSRKLTQRSWCLFLGTQVTYRLQIHVTGVYFFNGYNY